MGRVSMDASAHPAGKALLGRSPAVQQGRLSKTMLQHGWELRAWVEWATTNIPRTLDSKCTRLRHTIVQRSAITNEMDLAARKTSRLYSRNTWATLRPP